jgi:hypothetical protein
MMKIRENKLKLWSICLSIIVMLIVTIPNCGDLNTSSSEGYDGDNAKLVQNSAEIAESSDRDQYVDRIESIHGSIDSFENMQHDSDDYATLTEYTQTGGYNDLLMYQHQWSPWPSNWPRYGAWVAATGSLAGDFVGTHARINGALGGASGEIYSPYYNLAGCTGFNFYCVIGAVFVQANEFYVDFRDSSGNWDPMWSWANGNPLGRDWYGVGGIITSSQYMHSGFRVRYRATSIDFGFPINQAVGFDYQWIYVPENDVELVCAFDEIVPAEYESATLQIDMHDAPATQLRVSISHDGTSTYLGNLENEGTTAFDIKEYLDDPCLITLTDADASVTDPAPTSWRIERMYIKFEDRTYQYTDPIYIDSDEDEFLEKLYGYGTSESPYILKNMNISTGGPNGNGIELRNLDSHFIIRNCMVHSLATGYGVLLYNCVNVQIEDCTFAHISGTGVYLDSTCQTAVISGNIFEFNGVNAEDDGTGNVFNQNYWDDWTSPDNDYDGIVDAAYPIVGDASNSDPEPLVFPPGRPPISWVEEPESQIVEYGASFAYKLNVTFLDVSVSFHVNDTENFTISQSGLLTNATALMVGVYWINVSVSDNYDHEIFSVFNVTVTTPNIEWIYPDEGQEVIFPKDSTVFRFRYRAYFLSDVVLIVNNTVMGSVMDVDHYDLESKYTADTDGYVNVTLCGYEDGINTMNSTRLFLFSKLTVDVSEHVSSGTDYLGHQLYMILHDPNGDNSFSGYKYQTGLSIGVGSTLTASTGVESTIEPVPILAVFPGGPSFTKVGASAKLDLARSESYDFRYKIVQTSELTSNQDSSDPDYIGPGYGDVYWGEAWSCYWILQSHYREYFNNTKRYEAPTLLYQVIRENEVFLSDRNAPEEWRQRNPVHNNWQNVQWLDDQTHCGNIPTSDSIEVTNSETRKVEVTGSFQAEILLKFGAYWDLIDLDEDVATVTFSFGIEYQTYTESEVETTYTTSYTLLDDESSDAIVTEYGIDKTFGTPIFRPIPIACQTSAPLEHNTRDYQPPVIDFPSIIYDTSLDDISPCRDDNPYITVDIYEEGGIQSAIVMYSLNDAANWYSLNLTEQPANPGTWFTYMPSFDHLTEVLWYIRVWDNAGLYAIRMNPLDDYYRYKVINRVPTIQVISPNGNERFVDMITISWSASDLDDDTLTYTLSYNLEGTGWRLLAAGLTDTTYSWNISGISYCETVAIRVTVEDGFGGTAVDECDYVFTVGASSSTTTTPTGPPAGPGVGGFEPMSLGLGVGIGGAITAIALIMIFQKRTGTG